MNTVPTHFCYFFRARKIYKPIGSQRWGTGSSQRETESPIKTNKFLPCSKQKIKKEVNPAVSFLLLFQGSKTASQK